MADLRDVLDRFGRPDLPLIVKLETRCYGHFSSAKSAQTCNAGAMTKIWGHRGASAEAPENTLLAFARAARAGAHGVELDVHKLADGTAVIIHDATFDRTTNGTGPVHEATIEQVVNLRAGDPPQPIPTLDEVLQLLAPSDLEINVELKTDVVKQPGLVDTVLSLADDLDLTERIWWSSFNPYTTQELRRASATARLGLLQIGPVDWELAQDFAVQAVHPEHTLVDETLVAKAHRLGLRVHTWTVNNADRQRQLAAWGVDVLMTDDPKSALEVVGASA